MASNVDAVIAALRIVLREAEARTTESWWKTHVVNKWIDQLPGRRWGRWRDLRLQSDSGSLAKRENLITHVRATLAYLEVNRDAIKRRSLWSWPFKKKQKPALAPIDAEFKEISEATDVATKKPGKSVRVIK
jgi:hypothetical protein